ncbi:putative nitrilase [Aspergillus nomiae NRRL 13137]|uniref:nitrilase n=1 Tax=Aspergillus nomiae NRRL (strain ATCC 15546 / NRRL 13137 / CBS 260.88 / M93) TaxID=1509407 RepID=A0A0L1JEF8_ASPN3|nr:putative nitrilase [Aspergillus nomiae NRRL 13137]KNG90057.1 putative nitrilase [Aspergillus nomiae NRRL 13137]
MAPVCVGTVQAEPVFLDLDGSINKTIDIIRQAAGKGVQVLAFPEVWIGGYPWPIWAKNAFESSEFCAKYIAHSLPRDSAHMRRIQAACKEYSIFVVLGYSEKDDASGSIYISQAFISSTGEIVHNRRKIKPTYVERCLWGDGQGDSLKCVVDSPFGRIGALNCWENLQPLLRYYEYSQGVQIHVAGWPSAPSLEKLEVPYPYGCTSEACLRISQMVALEGQTFVLCSTAILRKEKHEIMGLKDKGIFHEDDGGVAMIFGPDGRPLVEPLPRGEEGILTAEVDLEMIYMAKSLCDPVGHYSRPDLLSLRVNSVKAEVVHHV